MRQFFLFCINRINHYFFLNFCYIFNIDRSNSKKYRKQSIKSIVFKQYEFFSQSKRSTLFFTSSFIFYFKFFMFVQFYRKAFEKCINHKFSYIFCYIFKISYLDVKIISQIIFHHQRLISHFREISKK